MHPPIRILAIILALLLLCPALAESATLTNDGVVRVRLSSLGNPQRLNFTVCGEYRLGELRFRRDAEIALENHDGDVWLSAGGVLANLGPEAVLIRGASESEANGLVIGDSGLYCGNLTVAADGGGLVCTLSIDMEEYLLGVVAYEMSDSFPVEALKAQSVAARTYAMQRKAASAKRDYDLKDTTADQVYKGYDARYENVTAAVRETAGMVGTVNGEFAACYYTASNGGEVAVPSDVWTGEDQGHIVRRADPYDLENPHSLANGYAFSADLSGNNSLKEMLERAANEQTGGDYTVERVLSVQPVKPEPEDSGRYTRLRFELELSERAELLSHGDGADFSVTLPPARETRTIGVELDVYEQIKPGLSIGLNGGDYERVSVTETNEGFVIEMRGFGHGVGMSQRGAQQMAGRHGKSWREILAFYYPGMTLERVIYDKEPIEEFEPLPERALPAMRDGEKIGTVRVRSALNVRETPAADARILTKLADGERVLVSGGPDENGWLSVRTADAEGFVKQEYIE